MPNRDGEIHAYSIQKLSPPPVQPYSGLIPPPFTCSGPQRRLPLPETGLSGRFQLPFKSGFPSARRGVGAAATAGGGSRGVSVQFAGVCVGLIADFTLAGTGITT